MTGDVCVVVPTVREYQVVRAYIENARSHGFDDERLCFVLVTEDHCDTGRMSSMLQDLGVTGEVFDRARRRQWFAARDLEEYADLIPRRSHAQTSFGLLYLWAEGFDYGMFIDDDTRPHPEVDFFGRHLRNLTYTGPIEQVRSDERWVNVLYQGVQDHGLYPRGYPYGAMDETVETDTTTIGDVVASQGLWTNVPDLDAVRILHDGDPNGQGEIRLTADHYDGNFVAAPGQYLTVCSMNLAFKREIVPAFYQLPMDDNRWSIGRFDDIWSGVLLKRACDLLGKQVVSGHPLCIHDKVPRSTFSDLAAEAPGLELNEYLWRIVDGVDGSPSTFTGAYAAMAAELATGDFDLVNGGFLNHIGKRMGEWLDCLATLRPPREGSPVEVPADD